METFTFFADPNHGWLRVPRNIIAELGLNGGISPYSYMDEDYVYLEEDLDIAVFEQAADKAKFEYATTFEHHKYIFIRHLPHYSNKK